jgi:hypothetical protein
MKTKPTPDLQRTFTRMVAEEIQSGWDSESRGEMVAEIWAENYNEQKPLGGMTKKKLGALVGTWLYPVDYLKRDDEDPIINAGLRCIDRKLLRAECQRIGAEWAEQYWTEAKEEVESR